MTVDHTPLAARLPTTTPAQRYPTPAISRPAWTPGLSEKGCPVHDEHGVVVAYGVGRSAAQRIAEGMTAYVQLDDDDIADEHDLRAERDTLMERIERQAATIREVTADAQTLATENGALRDERAQLTDRIAELEPEATRVRRMARDRDDLRNQVIDSHTRLADLTAAVRGAREEAEDAARSANRYRDERDRARIRLADTDRVHARGDRFLREVASAMDLPAMSSAIAVLDRARYLAGVNRDRLRRTARLIEAQRDQR